MKKTICLCLVLLLSLCCVFTGCGSKTTTDDTTEKNSEQSKITTAAAIKAEASTDAEGNSYTDAQGALITVAPTYVGGGTGSDAAPGSDAAIFDSGKFYMTGTMSSEEDGDVPIEIALDGNSVYMLSTFENINMGILMNGDDKYLIYPEGKLYVELNAVALKVIGLDESILDFNLQSFSSTTSTVQSSEQTKLKGQECTLTVYQSSDGTQIKRYTQGSKLLEIDSYQSDGTTLQSGISFSSITADIPSDKLNIPTDYSKVTIMKFMNAIMAVAQQ